MKKLLAVTLFCFVVSSAFAAGENLERCLYNNGNRMDSAVCDLLRKRAAQQNADNERRKEQAATRQAIYDQEQAQAEIKRQEERRVNDQRAQQWRDEQDRKNALAVKAQNEQKQWEVATAKAGNERVAKRKALCGDDYLSPRVGMTLSRAKECVADFKLKGQINRHDGVVSTYMAGPTYLHVMDGRIVSWGR